MSVLQPIGTWAPGVINPDGSHTLAYRYLGTIAPFIAIRAAGDVRVDASITDGFFQQRRCCCPSPRRRRTITILTLR